MTKSLKKKPIHNSLTSPHIIDVASQESGWSCVYVLPKSIFFSIFRLDFGAVLTRCYFGAVLTRCYFGADGIFDCKKKLYS